MRKPFLSMEFANFLTSIEDDFELPQGLLGSHPKEVFAWTYGIPGEIVEHVERADKFRQALRAEVVAWEHFEMAKQGPVEIERMRWEADVIWKAITGAHMTPKDRKLLDRRRKNRNRPRRVAVGAPE